RRVSPVLSGERDCCPFPRTPFPACRRCLRFAPDPLRTLGPLDQAEHFPHNQKASVATLRRVFGTARNAVRLQPGMLFGFAGIRRSPPGVWLAASIPPVPHSISGTVPSVTRGRI